jgi:hypothetical protein
LGKTSVANIARARVLKQQYGDMFGYYWLQEFGHSEFAEIWKGKHLVLNGGKNDA